MGSLVVLLLAQRAASEALVGRAHSRSDQATLERDVGNGKVRAMEATPAASLNAGVVQELSSALV